MFIRSSFNWKRFLLIAAAVWCMQATYATLNTGFFQQLSGNDVSWLAISIYSYCAAFVWFLCTPLIVYAIFGIGSQLAHTITRIAAHGIVAVLIAGLQRIVNIYLTYGLIKWTKAVDPSMLSLDNFLGLSYVRHVGNGVLIYFILVGIIYAYLFYVRNQSIRLEQAHLQAELSRVQLENLTYQFQPHFLFNSLQSVSTLMRRDVDAADRAIGDLAELLRYSIKHIHKQMTSVGEELLYLQKYIDMQQTRYGPDFTARIDFDSALLSASIPAFLLQPFVENSIKHGLEATGQAIEVQIRVYAEGDHLVFLCSDNGSGSTAPGESSGTGLSNMALRLKALYGDAAQLSYGRIAPRGYESRLILPMKTES